MRLDIRYIDHSKFYMFAVCFGFEIMEDLAPDGMTQLLAVSGPRPEDQQQQEY